MLKRPLIPLLLSFLGGIWIGHMGVPTKPPYLIALTLLIIALIVSSLFLSPRLRIPHFMVIFFPAVTNNMAVDSACQASARLEQLYRHHQNVP